MMKRIRSALLPLLACALFATSTMTMSTPQTSPVGNPDTINGTAIIPGVERLSYISTQYYGVRSTYDACLKETHGRVADQGDCADAEFKYQDERLNKAYKALTSGLSGTAKQAAVDAQRAWLAFFAKDCSARAARFGSDSAPATESICRMESTAIRAQQLEDWRSSLSASQSH
jgi:uncharacterized protein YecT (DUF1311 family)